MDLSSIIYGRKATIEHIKEVYATTCKLVQGPLKNGYTIHYKCCCQHCIFQIVYVKVKTTEVVENVVYKICTTNSCLQHRVVYPDGSCGLGGNYKSQSLSSVSYILFYYSN